MAVRQRVILIVLGSLIILGNLTNFYINRTQSLNYIAGSSVIEASELKSNLELDPNLQDEPIGERSMVLTKVDHSFETCELTHINIVSAAELELLPGIGPVLALRIIESREEELFIHIEDLMRVSGIGAKKFEQIAPLVCLATIDAP